MKISKLYMKTLFNKQVRENYKYYNRNIKNDVIFVVNKTHHASNPDFYRGSAPGWVFDFYIFIRTYLGKINHILHNIQIYIIIYKQYSHIGNLILNKIFHNRLIADLKDLLKLCTLVDIKEMGFPDEWEKETIWQ